MNERIRELSEQALEIVSNKRMLKDGQLERTWDPHEYDRVFTELIVQETLMQMSIQMNKFGDDQSNNPAWYKSEEAVKKHFGVKE